MKKKIFFVLPSLFGGGAEKVVLTIVKHIDKEKFDPTLVLLNSNGSYPVPKDTKVIDLNVQRARYGIFKVAGLLKKEKPDIVFSTLGHLNLLMSMIRVFFGKDIRFIARESNTVSMENQTQRFTKLFDFLYKTFYNNFDTIITQCNYMKKDLVENYGIKSKKITMIYNPVDIEMIENNISQEATYTLPKNKINLIAAGRLSRQKGFDILIEAMSMLDEKYHLTILGEGEEAQNLQTLVQKHNLQKQITFAGFQKNPHKIIKQSNLFILSSRYEGLPNILLEANACGIGVVAFDTPGGTAEIIEEGKNAILLKQTTPKALAQGIQKATQIDFDSQKIKEMIKQRFNVKKIIKEYEKVFIKTLLM